MYVELFFINQFSIYFCCDLEVIIRKMSLALFGLRVDHLASGKELSIHISRCFS